LKTRCLKKWVPCTTMKTRIIWKMVNVLKRLLLGEHIFLIKRMQKNLTLGFMGMTRVYILGAENFLECHFKN